ncbi:hypothetical protein, partial [Candidatus Accumulibacter vicinus]|uniref:hypothetical protein n=1 Tax=Candidatus Accumulibacter vicinus TaxID=2954382 RepID=UPI00235B6D69
MLNRPKHIKSLSVNLGHANGLFGEIVGEGDVVIGGEAPDIIGVVAQAEQEVCCFTLSCSPAFPRFRGERIQGFTFGEQVCVTGTQAGDSLPGQWTAQFVDLA